MTDENDSEASEAPCKSGLSEWKNQKNYQIPSPTDPKLDGRSHIESASSVWVTFKWLFFIEFLSCIIFCLPICVSTAESVYDFTDSRLMAIFALISLFLLLLFSVAWLVRCQLAFVKMFIELFYRSHRIEQLLLKSQQQREQEL